MPPVSRILDKVTNMWWGQSNCLMSIITLSTLMESLTYLYNLQMKRTLLLIFILSLCVITVSSVVWHTFSTSNKTGTILVEGDRTCHEKTSAALGLLKMKSPQYSSYVEKHIHTIQCRNTNSGIDPSLPEPTYYAGYRTISAGDLWYASTIVHDACHVSLFRNGKTWSGQLAEETCVEVQAEALKDMGADEATLKYLTETLKSEYWKDDDRWW
jgi:hypothetical protein